MRATMLRITVCCAAMLGMPALAAEHLVVVERPVGEVSLPLGGKEDAVGNMLVFANKVYDAANKVLLGSDQGFCVRTVVGKSWECVLTYVTKDGQITAEGPYLDSGDSTWSVTGGTGKWVGARGTMKLHGVDAKPTAIVFTYELI
ncbi:MAG TPA: allene oxide cyclase family protein [Steroidobacteraceae bacterium]|nr:allene oxide cyclase family protein [Steroidobacteraceae bacterium]